MRDFCIIVGRGCITELSFIICNSSYLMILWLFKCNVTTVSCFKYYKNSEHSLNMRQLKTLIQSLKFREKACI